VGLSKGEFTKIVVVYSTLAAVTATGFILFGIVGRLSVLLAGLGIVATEVALIAISMGIGVSSSVPIWMILVLPFMFTCGMVLVDTTDGVTMRMAYAWAFLNPIRKICYNLTVTIIFILVALAIGTVELLQVIVLELDLTGPTWQWVDSLDFETLGFGIIIIFLASWLISVAVGRSKRLDEVHAQIEPDR
jgi:high-affinity nickel-transport protein